jgi:O-antigen/teichoic acid export membrane protein
MENAASATNPESESLGSQVRKAVIWRSGTQIVAQMVQWSATFLVIRILTPSDYGLFAMTQVVLVLFNMLSGQGLASAAVQQRELTQRNVRQLFGMLLLMNVVLALGQFLLAPLAAAYYRQDSVTTVLRVQSLIFLTTPFIVLPVALLSRQMDFRSQAKANLASSFAGAVTALAGAFAGLGVWTLVLAPLALFAVRGAMLTYSARMLIWPTFDFRGAGSLAKYGGLMAMSSGFAFAASQSDVLVAGRQLDPHALGLYTTSLFLTQIFVSKFVPPLNEVAFSAYAKLQASPEAVGRAFLKLVRTVMVAGMPFYLGLAVTADTLVAVVMGSQWVEAAPIVRTLALAMPVYTLLQLLGPASDALGRPDISTRTLAAAALLLPPAFLIGLNWDVHGLALVWVLAFPILLIWSARRTLPLLAINGRQLADAVAPSALAALAMALIVGVTDRMLPSVEPVAHLAILIGVGAFAYCGWLLIFARNSVVELVDAVRGKI